MGNSNFINPADPPAQVQGSMPAAPGYVTSLQGDPNAPPVAYRNPDAPSPVVQPQQDPLAGLHPALRQWLQSQAARDMELQLKQEANRRAMGLQK